MKHFNSICRGFCLLLLFPCPSLYAQCGDDGCACNAVLMPTIQRLSESKQVSLSYLAIIDEQTFEEIKKAIKAGATIPIADIPIGGDMSWEDFQTRRSAKFRSEQFAGAYASSIITLNQYLPRNVTDAWLDCQRLCITGRTNGGIHCAVIDADEDSVVIKFTWFPPPGAVKDGIVESLQIEGASTRDAPIPPVLKVGDTIAASGETTRIFRREAGKTFKLAITVNSLTASVVRPKYQNPVSVEFYAIPAHAKGDTFIVQARVFNATSDQSEVPAF
jgi:hypothetical protein